VDVWLADGIRPFQLVLLAADKGDSGHSVEISYNQEAGYNALFDPVCDLEALKNTYKDGEERWED
jgi:hypothetical protein